MGIYAVPSGLDPVAAWIPSLDTAGNGTTTLTDLVGSNNGTLTNMDAGTDWVADTDNGGVRALDFNGVNGYVAVGDLGVSSPSGAISLWFNGSADSMIFQGSTIPQRLFVEIRSGVIQTRLGDSAYQSTGITPSGWNHLLLVWGNSEHLVYVDGVLVTDTNYVGSVGLDEVYIGCFFSGSDLLNFSGLIDDVRIFTAAPVLDDAAYLATARAITSSNSAAAYRRRITMMQGA